MKRASVDKWKRKTWCQLVSSKTFKEKVLGESITEKPELLEGRSIRVNARNVLEETRKSYFTLKFRVYEVRNNKGLSMLIGHEIKPGYVKRLTRKGMSKVESVKEYGFKDGKKARVKSVAVTRTKAAKKQKTGLLKALEEGLSKQCASQPYEEFVRALVEGKVQEKIGEKPSKIVPLRTVDVTKSTLLG